LTYRILPDHGQTFRNPVKEGSPSVQNHCLDSRCARMNEEPGVARWKNCVVYSRCDSLARAGRVWLSSLIVSLYCRRLGQYNEPAFTGLSGGTVLLEQE